MTPPEGMMRDGSLVERSGLMTVQVWPAFDVRWMN